MSTKDEVALFFHKLKSGCTLNTIATIFDVSVTTVSNIFGKIVDVIFDYCAKNLWWLSKKEIQETMPDSFKVLQLNYLL